MSETLLWVVDVVVRDGSVRRDTVVPESDGAFFPLHSDLEILAVGDVLLNRLSVMDLWHCCRESGSYLEQQFQQSI